jgi:DNA-directed RNA polymerase beta' subunit
MITQYELSEIADAKLQIITPKNSDPIIGLV